MFDKFVVENWYCVKGQYAYYTITLTLQRLWLEKLNTMQLDTRYSSTWVHPPGLWWEPCCSFFFYIFLASMVGVVVNSPLEGKLFDDKTNSYGEEKYEYNWYWLSKIFYYLTTSTNNGCQYFYHIYHIYHISHSLGKLKTLVSNVVARRVSGITFIRYPQNNLHHVPSK